MTVIWDFNYDGGMDFVKNGELHRVAPRNDMVMLESADDLEENELGDYPVGAIAHLAGWAQAWEMSAAGTWVSMAQADDSEEETEPAEDEQEPAVDDQEPGEEET